LVNKSKFVVDKDYTVAMLGGGGKGFRFSEFGLFFDIATKWRAIGDAVLPSGRHRRKVARCRMLNVPERSVIAIGLRVRLPYRARVYPSKSDQIRP